ncbi:MAG: hypothetical protein JNM82_01735, partial [Rhodocyclaceae bacterium]|nr:hypothetical protein [Rhodocyclaceae bacterium]
MRMWMDGAMAAWLPRAVLHPRRGFAAGWVRWLAGAALLAWCLVLRAATPQLQLVVDLDPASRRFSAVAWINLDA